MSLPPALPDAEAVAAAAADLVERAARDAVAARGVFHVALAGGSTPGRLYETLGRPPREGRIGWARTEVWFGDERCVPSEDERSNFRMAHRALLARVPLASGAVHRIEGEADPEEAARAYETELRSRIGDDPPRLDLALLGLGADGHTASLFPDDPGWRDTDRLVAPATAPAPPRRRVTLTPRALSAARTVAFLVVGSGKEAALRRVLEPGSDLPAARIAAAAGRLVWLVDRAAAGRTGKGETA